MSVIPVCDVNKLQALLVQCDDLEQIADFSRGWVSEDARKIQLLPEDKADARLVMTPVVIST